MIDFSKCPCIYWSNVTKISYLQRRIIVYSIMYYEYDKSCITDAEYDSISHQLVALQKKVTKEEFRKTTYYYAMYDFEGSTGFDIPPRLTKFDKEYLTQIALYIMDIWAKQNKSKNKKEKRK